MKMKISLILSSLLFTILGFSAEKQDPAKQHWDGKFFHKYTRPSLVLAKAVLSEYPVKDYNHTLDIGCGPGDLTAHIARRIRREKGKGGVLGVDPNKSMIDFAKVYYSGGKNLVFECVKLPWDKLKFDFIFSCNMFHLLTKEKQIATLKALANMAKQDKDVPLLVIMAAKTKEPQTFTRAYARTLAMDRWAKLRSINLDDYFQPHDAESINQLVKGTGFNVKEVEILDEDITFKNMRRLKKFITSWMGGFEFVAQMPANEQKKLLSDLVKNYNKEVPITEDGKIKWCSPRLILHAQKPKEVAQ